MIDFFRNLLSSTDFMPHGHCYFWTPSVLWTHVVSDIIIFAAYYSIPVALVYFVIKKKSVPFNWVFWMFGAFILLCGTTHIMAVWTIWHPTYRLEGLIKGITAAVSIATALALWPLIPKALSMPTPGDLQTINEQLARRNKEIEAEKEKTENALRDLRKYQAELEEKTINLEKLNEVMMGREMKIVELKDEVKKLKSE